MRIILFTGKGGVGKTSLSAATAVETARRGRSTVIISTDSAHSLSDIFETPLSGEPRPVSPGLDALEVDPEKEMEENWKEIRDFVSGFFSYHGLNEMVAEELSVLPGMEEIFSLMLMARFRQEQRYDCCVVDCAPTGSTLRLLSLPEIMRWYLAHIFPLQRTFWQVAEPVAHRVTSMPLPTRDFFDNIKRFYTAIGDMSDLMLSPETTIRLVVNPEKMVIHEARRAYTYFCLYGFRVDAIMVNRIFPESLKESYFDRWKALQKEYLQVIEHSFAPLPLCRTPLFEKEMLGAESLLSMAAEAYGGRDPAGVFHEGNPFGIRKKGRSYVVTIELPFVDKRDLDLLHRGDELIIRTGVGKRVITLPESMRGARVERAGMEGDRLHVYFEKKNEKGDRDHGKEKSRRKR